MITTAMKVSLASFAARVLILLLGLIVVVFVDGATAATTSDDPLCSCSPTQFTFVLSLDQTCDNNDIEDNTGGIIGSFCFTETDVAVPAPSSSSEEESVRRKQRALQTTSGGTTTTDPVTEIVSVQFLEFDTSGDLTVINQDDTYADVSLSNGDTLTFYSASSYLDTSLPLEEQMSGPALVPGGASLILYGKTASGAVVRNRFFWMYDTENCGSDSVPIRVDDEIGWVTVSEISNAWPTFCPALAAGSPTISPRTNEPTMVPSHMPTPMMSMSMSMSMPVVEEAGWGSDGYDDITPSPTAAPTRSPAEGASWGSDGYGEVESPTNSPSASPMEPPTCAPATESPTASPTESPTESPTSSPVTESPTVSPTSSPVTEAPTESPTSSPVTESPTVSPTATESPSLSPVMPDDAAGEEQVAGDEGWIADGWTGDGGSSSSSPAPSVAPTSKTSSLEGWGGSSSANDIVFGSKPAKTHYHHHPNPDGAAKSSKSGKGSKSVQGKTGKEDEDRWGGAYGMGKITSYSVLRSSGRMSSSGLAMISLVVMSILLLPVRQ